MATQLEIVNDVMIKLREDTVSTVAETDYSRLIASFVNDSLDDLEDMWFWTVNETEIDVSILADGTRTYDLATTNDRSFMIRNARDEVPMAYDITANEKCQLQDFPLKDLRAFRNTMNTIDNVDRPINFALDPAADGRGYGIELFQGSTTARTWRMYWYVPQVDLALDGSDDNTEILLPRRPVYLTALYYALNERGEEMGEPGQIAERRAHRAAAAAMELDMQVNKVSDARDMTNLESLRNRIREGY